MPMLNASFLPPHKMSYSIQLMPMPSVPLHALWTTGSAGPSGLDAHEWRRLCTAFKGVSTDLYKCVSPFLACHLIALDKSPGVHPIGIGDTAR